jgi:hypothetical protein
MCSKGRADVVDGVRSCLTANGVCWSPGDPNTAGPCVQSVIDANADENVKAAQASVAHCAGNYSLVVGAIAAEMTDADRATFAACLSHVTDCTDASLTACLNGLPYEVTLCQ